MLSLSCRIALNTAVRTVSTSSYITSQSLAALRVTSSPSPLWLTISRNLSTYKLNKHLEFFASDECPILKPKEKSFELPPERESAGERPLVLLMAWMLSKDLHMKKFIDFYNDLGFDVLKIKLTPMDLLRPTKGSHVVAAQMLEFLHQNPRHNAVVVHGFSVGCYLFNEGLVQVDNDLARHGKLYDRLVGQIWDSPVDIHGIPLGLSRAITNNKVLQVSLQKKLEWFMKIKYQSATQYYEKASLRMHQGINKPALFIISRKDPVSSVEMVSGVYDKWEKKGIPYFVKIFEESQHVSHFHKYRQEYIELVLDFLARISLIAARTERAAA